VDHFEVIVGRHATLRLSIGTARLLYRGVLALTVLDDRNDLPAAVRSYIERRRAMLGCHSPPIDLLSLLSAGVDGHAQRSLANLVRRIAMNAARFDSAELGISPSVRIRFVAALIEVYRLLCANLPVDLTLPPPVGISLSRNEWRLIEIERQRLRSESAGAAVQVAARVPVALPPLERMHRDETVHRQISVFAG
jgi:hypothetical protein